MCMSMAPAKFSTTKLYVGEAKKDNKYVHVLAYQNNALSLEPNAMILPFPTAVPMDERNIINTTSFKGFLTDIGNASRHYSKGMRMLSSLSDDLVFGSARVFDVGSYTVVLADNVKQIPKALERVHESRRPQLTPSMLLGFGKLYPDQPVAVCCWNGSVEAEPLLWWYEPKNRDVMFVPTMDSHDGKAPNLETEVETDHIISTGSALQTVTHRQNQVLYSGKIPEDIRSLLPNNAYGTQLPARMRNGDMFIKTSEVRDNILTNNYPLISRGTSLSSISGAQLMQGWVA